MSNDSNQDVPKNMNTRILELLLAHLEHVKLEDMPELPSPYFCYPSEFDGHKKTVAGQLRGLIHGGIVSMPSPPCGFGMMDEEPTLEERIKEIESDTTTSTIVKFHKLGALQKEESRSEAEVKMLTEKLETLAGNIFKR